MPFPATSHTQKPDLVGHKSASLAVLLFTVMAAGSAPASAAPCFVQPMAGAKASLDGKPLAAAAVGDRCESLQVLAGQVQVVYTDGQGTPLVELVEAGKKPELKSIGTSDAFTEVQRIYTGVRDTVGGSGAKQAEGARYLPMHLGLPMGAVHVSDDGLKFKVLPLPARERGGAAPQAGAIELRILPPRSGAAVLITTVKVGDVVHLPKAAFKPGGSYEVQAVVSTASGKLSVADRMTVLPLADANALEARLKECDEAAGQGTPASRVARALVYASETLAFNSRMSLEMP